MPLIDDNGDEIDLEIPFILQDFNAQQRTIQELETYRDELEDDIGKYSYRPLSTGRVLVILPFSDPLVAYMSDTGPDQRVVLDDIVAELWPSWRGNPDAKLPPVKPKDLGAT